MRHLLAIDTLVCHEVGSEAIFHWNRDQWSFEAVEDLRTGFRELTRLKLLAAVLLCAKYSGFCPDAPNRYLKANRCIQIV